MEYIVIDMEWNQPFEGRKRTEFAPDEYLHGEVIQIGAVKLSEDGGLSTFNSLVKPQKYVKMNRRVEALTGIHAESLEDAPSFPEAFCDFLSWCGEDILFITWGFDDIRILRQNLEMHGIDPNVIPRWVNLQLIYNKQTDSDASQKSLQAAMEHFSISPEDNLPAHNALADAYYTALVCRKLDLEKGIAEYSFGGKYDRFEKKQPRRPEKRKPRGRRSYAKERAPEPTSEPIPGKTASSKTTFTGFETKKAAFLDPGVSSCVCPECGTELSGMSKWSRKQNFRYKAKGICPEHGSFSVRLAFRREGACWSVSKVIYSVSGEVASDV